MIGAIIGDMLGSRFEIENVKSKDFALPDLRQCEFTDDTVMTIAVASALVKWKAGEGDLSELAIKEMRRLGRKYPNVGYGGMFAQWLFGDIPLPYGSYGNGAAMRVSACGWMGECLDEVCDLSAAVTEVTHNHFEALRGAEAVAVCVYLARSGHTKDAIRRHIEENYYPLDFTLDEIRPTYEFDASCQGTVPQALEAFLESVDFMDAIRNAISIGGDSDTIAAITGAIAEAYWGISKDVAEIVKVMLPKDLYDIIDENKLGKNFF